MFLILLWSRLCLLCRQLVTLTVGGGIELAIHVSPGSTRERSGGSKGEDEGYRDPPVSGLSLRNVRIVVKSGAMLSVGVAGDYSLDDMGYAGPGEGTSALTLEGAAPQVRSTAFCLHSLQFVFPIGGGGGTQFTASPVDHRQRQEGKSKIVSLVWPMYHMAVVRLVLVRASIPPTGTDEPGNLVRSQEL